ELNQLGSGLQPQNLHDSGLVELGGSSGDPQQRRDLLGRVALGDELQDLPLPRRQLAQRIGGGRGSSAERIQQVPGDLRGDVCAPLEYFLDGGDQGGGGGVFQDEARGAGLQASRRIGDLAVHGQDDHFQPGVGGAHFPGGVDPVEGRHRDIGDDDVG